MRSSWMLHQPITRCLELIGIILILWKLRSILFLRVASWFMFWVCAIVALLMLVAVVIPGIIMVIILVSIITIPAMTTFVITMLTVAIIFVVTWWWTSILPVLRLVVVWCSVVAVPFATTIFSHIFFLQLGVFVFLWVLRCHIKFWWVRWLFLLY